jgi:hypothetical protein
MNLDRERCTSVGADEIGAVAEGGVVEGVVIGCDRIFVTEADCKPVADVFLDLEGHLAGFVALLLEGRLNQTEVVVVSFR